MREENEMNLNQIAKKLQRAILQKGLIIKMGTSQFYSDKEKRMITMYILSTNVMQRNRYGKWEEKNYDILRTASQVEIVECLKDIWQAVKE